MPSVKKRSLKKFKRKLAPFQRPKTGPHSEPRKAGTADEAELSLDEEDKSFVREYGSYGNFLANLDTSALSKKSAKLPAARPARTIDLDELEVSSSSSLEDESSSSSLETDSSLSDSENVLERHYELSRSHVDDASREELAERRLPVMTESGTIRRVSVSDEMLKDSEILSSKTKDLKAGKFSSNTPTRETPSSPKIPAADLKVYSSLSVSEALEKLAEFTTLLLEDPEKNYALLKNMPSFLAHPSALVQKRALLCQLAVFLDIVPGYRIRELTEKESNQTLSKQVQSLWNYEQALLKQYHGFLNLLEKLISRNLPRKMTVESMKAYLAAGNEKARDLVHTCFTCLGRLLVRIPHFNYRLLIIKSMVIRMHRYCPSDLVNITCVAFRDLFKADDVGEYSKDAVKMISRFTKNVQFKVCPALLETFLDLQLSGELLKTEASVSKKLSKKQRVHRSRSVRKVIKKEKEIEAELSEASAVADKNEKAAFQKETLEFLFMVYFRVLKSARDGPLMSVTLQGLAQFASLINVDFFDDLTKLLREICHEKAMKAQRSCENAQLALRDALNCTLASLKIFNVQQESDSAIGTDLHDFSRDIYSILILIPALPNSEENVDIALQVLRLLFSRQRGLQAGSARIAAFAKRLSTLALSGLESSSAFECLKLVFDWTVQFPKIKTLLDSESKIGSGKYLPFLSDPDLCNVWTTGLYETHAIAMYSEARVASLAKEFSRQAESVAK